MAAAAAACPTAAALAWGSYLLLRHGRPRWLLPADFARWSALNQMCWAQNLTSFAHSIASVSILLAAIATDPALRRAGLGPYASSRASVGVGLSLGYFAFALPWSIHLYFCRGARLPYTSLSLCAHHALVALAEATYLLTHYLPWHGALAIILMELTNWFYLPHVLLKQLGAARGRGWLLLGMLFVGSFVGCRVVGCTYLAVSVAVDLARFRTHDATSAASLCVLAGCFYALLLLSYYWFVAQVVPQTHAALKALLGDAYLVWCCPAPLQAWLARHSTEARRRRQEVAKQLQLMRELKEENACAEASSS